METHRPAALRPHHLTGRVAVYVRQSTLEQTRTNTGSTAYQLGQIEWALKWGYPRDQIDVIDQDLSLSGSAAAHRLGYLRVRDGIQRDIYKLVLVSDLTRLGRDADESFEFIRDCKRHDALIGVDGEVLDARHKYDLVRARLSAMFAELDRDNIRDTMERGRKARLAQGRAVSVPPAGYRARAGKWELDPRPEVQASIRACFDLFLEYRSMPSTVAAMRAREMRIPRRRPGGDVEFVPAKVHSLRAVLKNPAYKGEYHYGRTHGDPAAGRDARGRVRLRRADPANIFVIAGHHDAYVSEPVWDEVQQIIAENTWTAVHPGIGAGAALLQGIVRCDRCGFSMSTLYKSQRQDGDWSSRYQCIGTLFEGGKPCGGVPGKPLDLVIGRQVLARITPVHVAAVAAAYRDVRDAESAEAHRRTVELHRLRARVADLEFRYLQADPANTHVLRTVETRLEEAKRALERLEAGISTLPQRILLSDAQFAEMAQLAHNVDAIFSAGTTTNHDRKEIVRMMVARVIVEDRTNEVVCGRIEWKDGAPATKFQMLMIGFSQRRIRELSEAGLDPSAIADRLNAEGVLTKYRTLWNGQNVRRAISRIHDRNATHATAGST